VRCATNRHRVRLARGRFWARARCPSCRSRVDPTRLRRIGRWIAQLAVPASRSPIHRAVWWVTGAYLVFALASAVGLWWLSDRWWPATTLLFGPRWVLLLPLVPLVAAALRWDRPLLAPLVLAGLIVVGPVMGLHTGWRALFVSPGEARDLRVVTFNAMAGGLLRTPIEVVLFDWNADVVALQECSGRVAAGVRALTEWHTELRGSLCIISRFPIAEVAKMDNSALRWAGGSGDVVTVRLDVNGDSVFVTDLHLETPRAGFERIRAGHLFSGANKLREKSILRKIELERARRWVDEYDGPHIVVGDFNTPGESTIFRSAWGDWQDAFSKVGHGLGGTRLNGWIRARIDHVLVNDDWRVVRARTGEDVGSDHLPVIAVVRRARGR